MRIGGAWQWNQLPGLLLPIVPFRADDCRIWLDSKRCSGTNALRGPRGPIRMIDRIRDRRHMTSAKLTHGSALGRSISPAPPDTQQFNFAAALFKPSSPPENDPGTSEERGEFLLTSNHGLGFSRRNLNDPPAYLLIGLNRRRVMFGSAYP